MRRLNDAYAGDSIFYWCNGAGEINIPGKDPLYAGHESEMPDGPRYCYSRMNSIDPMSAIPYTVTLDGTDGVAFLWLFDEEYTARFGCGENAFQTLIDVANILEQTVTVGQGRKEWLVGENTDPSGHELIWFVEDVDFKAVPIQPYTLFEHLMGRRTV